MPHPSAISAALLLVALCCVTTVSASQPACDASKHATCQVCSSRAADSNFIGLLPRRDRTFTEVSSNWADYPWVNCTTNAATGNSHCSMASLSSNGLINNTDPRAPYIYSIVAYIAVALLMVVLSFFWVTCLVFWRYCCCCCCRASQRCKCGGKYPTRRTMCVGYAHRDGHRFEYSKRSRVLSLLYLLSFLGLLIAFILVAEFKGNKALTTAVEKTFTTTLDPFQSLVTSVVVPLKDLIVGLSSDTLANTLLGLKQVVTNNTNLPNLVGNLSCALNVIDTFPNVDTMIASVVTMQAVLSNGTTDLTALQAQLGGLTANKSALQGDHDSMLSLVNALSYEVSNFSANANGLSNILKDVTDIQAGISAYQTNFPTSTAATGLSNDITALKSGTYFGSAGPATSGRSSFITDLTNMQSGLQQIGNLSTLASLMRDLNSRVAAVVAAGTSAVRGDLSATKASFDAFTSTAVVNSSLLGLQSDLYAMNTTLSSTYAVLQLVHADVCSVAQCVGYPPNAVDLGTVNSSFHLVVHNTSRVVPCLSGAIDEVLSLNVSVISLPDQIKNISTLVDKINDKLQPAIDQLNNATAAMNTAVANINAYNVSSFLVQVQQAQRTLSQALSQLNIGSIQGTLQSLNNTAAAVNFGPSGNIASFDTALKSINIDTNLIASLSSFESSRSSLLTALGTSISDMTALAQGYCQGTPATLCAATTAGCTCQSIGVSRCRTDNTVACQADATCSSGGCLYEPTFYDGLKSAVDALYPPGPIDMTSATTQLSSAQSATSIDFTTLRSQLSANVQSSQGFDFSNMDASLAQLQSGLNSADVSTYYSMVDSVLSGIGNVTFTSVISKLTDFNGTVHDFQTKQRKIVADAHDGASMVNGLLFDRLPAYLTTLSRTNLEAVFASGGLSAVVEQLLTIGDDATNYAVNSTTLLSNGTRRHDGQSYAGGKLDKVLNVLSLPSYRLYGSAYYLGSLLSASGLMDITVYPGDATNVTYAQWDSNGDSYPSKHYCLTTACLKSTVDLASSASLSSSALGLPVAVPLSRENLAELLLVIPFLIVLLGLWGILCAGCCCRNKPAWQKVPVSWMTGLTFAQMPCVFLFAGFFFVFVIVWGDFCQSYGGVAMQYVNGMGDSLCTSTLSGHGTLQNCQFNRSVYDTTDASTATTVQYNVSVGLNLQQLVVSLLGKCPTGVADPIATPVQAVASEIRPWPLQIANVTLNKGLGQLALREPLKSVLRTSADSLGSQTSSFLVELSDSTLACGPVSNIVTTFHDNICCDILSSVYWWLSAWYIMAWSMLFCGCCSGTLARKRLPKFPWGAQYDQDITEIPHMGTLEMVVSPTALVDGKEMYGDQLMVQSDLFPGTTIEPMPQGDAGYYEGYPVASGYPQADATDNDKPWNQKAASTDVTPVQPFTI